MNPSLEGKFSALLVGLLTICVLLSCWLTSHLNSPILAALVSLLIVLPVSLLLMRIFSAPINRLLRALLHGFDSFIDEDYSVRLAINRRDELGELVVRYNRIGEALRRERSQIHQRELLLESVLQSNPAATILTSEPDVVLFANLAARELLGDGKRLERQSWKAIQAQAVKPLQEALNRHEDSLFTLNRDDQQEIYHCSQRALSLNGLTHHLTLIRPITRELNRQEVAIWKKLIRVISHELNNSLAPISSLSHSAGLILKQHSTLPNNLTRLPGILETIGQRARHLADFMEGYVRFARLPAPQCKMFAWPDFLQGLSRIVAFEQQGELPAAEGYADPAQLEQALINLLKNAHESGSSPADISLAFSHDAQGQRLIISDRGTGMNERQMAQALLPFYSTKKSGSGLGLPLAREIFEAHGGSLHLANRDGGGLTASAWLPNRRA